MANATRSEKLDLRLTPEAKRVLNAAAQARHAGRRFWRRSMRRPGPCRGSSGF